MDWLDFLFEINVLFCYIIEESFSDIFGGRDIFNFNNKKINRYLNYIYFRYLISFNFKIMVQKIIFK